MAKVGFVQNLAIEYIGTMYLSAALKMHHHQTEVFIGNGKKIIQEIVRYKPDLLAFSCTTEMETWCIKIASKVKEQIPVKVILGGPHPTFFPEVIKEEPVDIICRGEGDQAIIDIANMLDKGSYLTNIANCWFSVDGKIVKNDLRPLIEDLNSLPFPDRDIYRKKYPSLRTSTLSVFTGRGCPFDCTYCFNKTLKELYCNKGAYVRKRSIDSVISEIKKAESNKKIRTVYFCDDTFFINKKWLKEFAVRYKQQVNIPYICLLRIEQIDEESAALLKISNCQRVFFGIESGSESLRFKILNRHITDKQIIEAGRLLKKYSIPFRTYNMLGLPGETMEDAFKTVELNIVIKTDYPWCSLFYPYPGTELGSYVAQNNLIIEKEFHGRQITFFKKALLNRDITMAYQTCKNYFFMP